MARSVTVKAKPGLKIFFPQSVVAAPGRRTLTISDEETVTVDRDERFVAKRIKVGDLVVVKETKTTKPSTKPPAKTKDKDE